MNNTFGNIFTLTSFGESHGKAIGGVIDGFPWKYIYADQLRRIARKSDWRRD